MAKPDRLHSHHLQLHHRELVLQGIARLFRDLALTLPTFQESGFGAVPSESSKFKPSTRSLNALIVVIH